MPKNLCWGYLAANFSLDNLGRDRDLSVLEKPGDVVARDHHGTGTDRHRRDVLGRLHQDIATLGSFGEDFLHPDGRGSPPFFNGGGPRVARR